MGARRYAAASRAPRTLRAYESDWADFTAWCEKRGLQSCPAAPATVALYLTELAEKKKASTLARRLVSIAQAHKAAGHPSPTADETVRLVHAGIRRSKGIAPRQARPLVVEDIRRLVDTCGEDRRGLRDRALILLGFAGALRRSELASLEVADVTSARDGLVVTIRRSKTDPEGEGQKVGIPYGSRPATCPVRSLAAWRDAAGISEGPLFRPVDRHDNVLPSALTDRSVALILKRRAELVGLEPTDITGHSLRAGLATSAAAAGVPERVIAATTRHKSMTVLRRYIREGDLFRENAAAAVGL